MLRIVVLGAILALVEPYTPRCRVNPPFHGDQCPGIGIVLNLDLMSDPIERDLIEKEEELAQFCEENSPERIGQMYSTDSYYLIYDLIEANNNPITVRIKHRYLHVTVKQIYGNQEIIFQDLKVLPDIVNTNDAAWTYKDGRILIIRIPYIVPLGTLNKNCQTVKNYVIYVSYKPPSEFNYGLQGWSQNGFNPPPGRPSGRPSGFNYGSQGGSQYGHNVPPGRPFGPNYESQNSTQNGPADPSSGFTYRSMG